MAKKQAALSEPKLTPYQHEQALAVASAVRARLLAEDPDIEQDEDLYRDMVDGESDALDIARRYVRAYLNATAFADAAVSRAAAIAERAKRFERRAAAFKGAAFAVLQAAGIERLPDPEFTAYTQPGQQWVDKESLDLGKLGGKYVKIERKPDLTAIRDDLLQGVVVDGAQLTNGSISFVIKSR